MSVSVIRRVVIVALVFIISIIGISVVFIISLAVALAVQPNAGPYLMIDKFVALPHLEIYGTYDLACLRTYVWEVRLGLLNENTMPGMHDVPIVSFTEMKLGSAWHLVAFSLRSSSRSVLHCLLFCCLANRGLFDG